MFIYNGKFTWLNYASNETITVVFPAGFALNDPVSAYWQWSTDALVHKKATVSSVRAPLLEPDLPPAANVEST